MSTKQEYNQMKTQIKQKTNEFMQYYQRLMKEKQFQKQKIKQNVMLEIMSNRQKSQSINSNDISERQSIRTQKNSKDVLNDPKFIESYRKSEFKRQNNKQQTNQINPYSIKNKQQQMGRSHSMPFKQEEFNSPTQQQQQYQNHKQPIKIQYAEITFKNKIPHEIDIKQVNESQYNNKKTTQYVTFRDSRTIVNLPTQFNNSKKIENENQMQPQYQTQQQKSNSQINIQKYDNYQKGVFLTVNNESQMIDDEETDENKNNKNIAFDIVLEKSDVNAQNIDQLRKKKIFELEKKRQQRLEDTKKNNVQKQLSKGKYQIPSNKKIQDIGNNGSQDEDTQINQQKNKPKTTKHLPSKTSNSSLHDLTQQHNQTKPQELRSTYFNQKRKVHVFKEERAQSPNINTPKTNFTSKNKLAPKSNIFTGESPSRDKSASRINQGKDKNKSTFNKQSNKKLMITAITYVCLPGQLNRRQREKLIQVIENQSQQFFIFLFKEYSRKVVKGIYILDLNQNKVIKIYGDKAPNELYSQQIQQFYRFDSGSRQFKKLDGCKSFSLAVHAIDLK